MLAPGSGIDVINLTVWAIFFFEECGGFLHFILGDWLNAVSGA